MRRAITTLILAVSPALLAAQGRVTLVVTAAGTGAPVPFVDVHVPSSELRAFGNATGVITLVLATDTATVHVRRIGFRPRTLHVRASRLGMDTVPVALAPVVLRLEAVRITDAVCPGDSRNDTAVVAILEQVRMNAERSRLLARTYPYVSTLEREFANGGYPEGSSFSRRTGARQWAREVLRVDTMDVASNNGWRYAPGRLIVPNDREIRGIPFVREKMILPQLADFADDAFIASHCFRYAGLDEWDGTPVFRVDFEPTRRISTPDVSGSLYFTRSGYAIVRSTLLAERPVTSSSGMQTLHVRVETMFTEFLPGMPMIEYVESTTATSSSRSGQRPALASETQRLLSFEFVDRAPGEP
jgi:hypothetical protein